MTVTLPSEHEVGQAIRQRDLVRLLALDGEIRDSLPIGQGVSGDTALRATSLLEKIAKALEGVTLSDTSRPSAGIRRSGGGSPGQRADEVREALKVTQRGRIDVEAIARAAAIRARMRP